MAVGSIEYGADRLATHTFEEGSTTKHVERVAPSAGILPLWEAEATITAVGLVGSFSVNTAGKGRVVVGCLCDAALAATLKLRLVFKNSANAIVGVSAEATSALGEVTDGGSPAKRYGTILAFSNDVGASSVNVYVTALPAAATSLDIKGAAI